MCERRFVAIDGEGYTDAESGEHMYTLLACSLGDYVWNPKGISTKECFDFLLRIRAKAKRYKFVAFGLNYDVNMMLRDLGEKRLEELWVNHRVYWHNFHIEWIPGKWLSVSKETKAGKSRIRIFDVFGFFQKSFVNSLKAWNIPVQENMEDMKASRSQFEESMRQRIIDYCISECEALVTLCDALHDALKSVDLVPQSWVGAGSIAASILRKEGVRERHVYDFEFPPEVQHGVIRSYFGGRVELFQQGSFNRLIDYDVRSAYPSQSLLLPPLGGNCHWEKLDAWTGNEYPYSLWKVSWKLDIYSRLCPFPVRYKRNIYYPSAGSGWYHYPEVKRAIEIFGDKIKVHSGYAFVPDSEESSPFDFVREGFKRRAELKAKGHAGEKVIKLGLNALYGKLAQGHGYMGKLPPFQSYFWAGRITSGTRAKLLDVASIAPESLVMIATDGIFFRDPAPDIVVSNELGGWEKSILEDAFVAQPGVYAGVVDGEEIKRSRGFFAKEIDFDSLREGYRRHGADFVAKYSSTRFVGLGAALARNDRSVWRSWQTSERALSLYPNRKFILADKAPEPTIHYPPSLEGKESQPYVPKDGDLDWMAELHEYMEGMEQPMRDF